MPHRAPGADDRPGSACSARRPAWPPPATPWPTSLVVVRTTSTRTAWETTNLLTISTALAEAAARREETRGSHWRDDFPDRDDERFAGHFDARMVDGELALEFWPAPQTDPTLAVVAR